MLDLKLILIVGMNEEVFSYTQILLHSESFINVWNTLPEIDHQEIFCRTGMEMVGK
jgi:hypothetical protein